MKQIPLRSLTDAPGDTLEWKAIITQVIRRPLNPQQGADIEEIRRGIRVLEALDHAGLTLELEDSDWQHLCEKVKAMQWGVIDRRVVVFVDDVLGATDGTVSNGLISKAVASQV